MKKIFSNFILFSLASFLFIPMTLTMAQENDTRPHKKAKAEQKTNDGYTFAKVDSLLKTRRFVFKADFNAGSSEVFVMVDSLYAMVQNGNRNNLEGQVTQCKVKRDDKRKTISVTLMLHGAMSTADVFIFMGDSGKGKATINCDFPGDFSFDGNLVDIEHSEIYEGGSHFLH